MSDSRSDPCPITPCLKTHANATPSTKKTPDLAMPGKYVRRGKVSVVIINKWTLSEEHADPFVFTLHIRVAVFHCTQEQFRGLALAVARFRDLIERDALDLVARVTVLEASIAVDLENCQQGLLNSCESRLT